MDEPRRRPTPWRAVCMLVATVDAAHAPRPLTLDPSRVPPHGRRSAPLPPRPTQENAPAPGISTAAAVDVGARAAGIVIPLRRP